MTIDPRTFRQTVGQFATGVTVVAMDVDGDVRAMTANSFTSLSLDPPLVLFCLGKGTATGQAIDGVAAFSVNILHRDQEPLSAYFAGMWEGAPPPFSFTRMGGVPILDGSLAVLGCEVHAVHDGGDHWIVVGRVTALERTDDARPPLVFFRGRYTALAEETRRSDP